MRKHLLALFYGGAIVLGILASFLAVAAFPLTALCVVLFGMAYLIGHLLVDAAATRPLPERKDRRRRSAVSR